MTPCTERKAGEVEDLSTASEVIGKLAPAISVIKQANAIGNIVFCGGPLSLDPYFLFTR